MGRGHCLGGGRRLTTDWAPLRNECPPHAVLDTANQALVNPELSCQVSSLLSAGQGDSDPMHLLFRQLDGRMTVAGRLGPLRMLSAALLLRSPRDRLHGQLCPGTSSRWQT